MNQTPLVRAWLNYSQGYPNLVSWLWGIGTDNVAGCIRWQGRFCPSFTRYDLSRHGYLLNLTPLSPKAESSILCRLVRKNHRIWLNLRPYGNFITTGDFLHSCSCVDCWWHSATNHMAPRRRPKSRSYSWGGTSSKRSIYRSCKTIGHLLATQRSRGRGGKSLTITYRKMFKLFSLWDESRN